MRLQLRFRTRLTLLATTMAAVLSILFAWASIYFTEDYEHIVVEAILENLADDYAQRLVADPSTALPKTRRIRAFADTPAQRSRIEVPAGMKTLPIGIHESELDGEEGIHVGVFDTIAGRMYFAIDLQDIEALERHLLWMLLAFIACGTVVGAWLGWLVARATALPIANLARQVEILDARPVRTSFRQGLPDDELGRLGASVDAYQDRLVQAAEAEQDFLADASHELRTPIAVVRGALELLREDLDGVDKAAPRLQRLERGVTELSELVESLFRLARRQFQSVGPVAAREWLSRVFEAALARHALAVELRIDTGLEDILLSSRDAELVLRAVVRHLIPPSAAGILLVQADFSALTLKFKPETAASPIASRSDAPARTDLGLGVSLTGRLLRAQGWRVDETLHQAGIIRLVWQVAKGHT